MKSNRSSSDRPRTNRRSGRNSDHTISPDEIPPENRMMEGVREGLTEGANPGITEPAVAHPNRPEREKSGGNFNGPDKPRRR